MVPLINEHWTRYKNQITLQQQEQRSGGQFNPAERIHVD